MSQKPVGAVVDTAGGAVRIEELEVDTPGPGEVLVRLVASGVCHSDLWAIEPRELGAAVPDAARSRGRRASSRRSVTASRRPPWRSGRPLLGGAVWDMRSLSARRPAPVLPCVGAASSRPPGAGRRAALGDALARHPRHAHRRARRAGDPDAGRTAAPEWLPPGLRRLDRRRRGHPDGQGVARGARVAVIGLGGIGLAALQGAKDRRRRSG